MRATSRPSMCVRPCAHCQPQPPHPRPLASVPQFVEVDYDTVGQHYKYAFAQLLLVFSIVADGEVKELMFIKYLYPDEFLHDLPREDGINLYTHYVFPARTKDLCEVLPVASAKHRAPLFAPPLFHPVRGGASGLVQRIYANYYLLNEDIYGKF